MPTVDHFPSTHGTWIEGQLERIAAHAGQQSVSDATAALRKHLMERYYEPLCVYVRAQPLIALGEPADIVGDFFARDVDAVSFLARWRQSGMPLRRWMMNAMALHCRSLARDAGREARRHDRAVDVGAVAESGSRAERAFDRAWALAIAGRAFHIAQADAESRARPLDVLAFRLHTIDGLGHESIARQLGITESQSSNACRRISARMREAIADLLRQDGVPPAQLDAAVGEVLALVRDSGR